MKTCTTGGGKGPISNKKAMAMGKKVTGQTAPKGKGK